MNELIKVEVNDNQEPVISARELYDFLGVKKRFSAWWETQLGYGFEDGEDFCHVLVGTPQNQYGGTQDIQDYAMKLDMAKELAMVSKCENGKKARKYFIQIEKDWNSPEKVMARALLMANNTIRSLETKLEEAKPKLEFANSVEETGEAISMGDMAKLLKKNGLEVGRNRLYEYLRDNKILMSGNSKNIPYQKYMEMKWFEITENVKFGKLCVTTLVLPKGQIGIVNHIKNNMEF